MSRWFNLDGRRAFDEEGQLYCQQERVVDQDIITRMMFTSFRFEFEDKKAQYVGIAARISAANSIAVIDGIRCIDILIGDQYSWQIHNMLALKSKLNFPGGDLEFLMYVGAGMAACRFNRIEPVYIRAILNRDALIGDIDSQSMLKLASLPETQWGPVLCLCGGRRHSST